MVYRTDQPTGVSREIGAICCHHFFLTVQTLGEGRNGILRPRLVHLSSFVALLCSPLNWYFRFPKILSRVDRLSHIVRIVSRLSMSFANFQTVLQTRVLLQTSFLKIFFLYTNKVYFRCLQNNKNIGCPKNFIKNIVS